MYPNEDINMPNDSANMEQHNLTAEYKCKYRKRKTQENKTPQASTPTDPSPIPNI
jgi:hypothetical protein